MRFMKRPRPTGVAGFFLAALLVSSAWASVSPPPQPGTLNYIEGRAFEGGQPLNGNSVGIIELTAGESLSTEEGKVEILLTPGIFFRLDDRSSMRMISPGLADTVLQLQNGRAMVDVASILPENNVRINECGASTQLLKVGLYDFDASRGLIRVFDGKALVQAGSKQIEVGGGHQLDLNMIGKLKTRRFDKNTYTDDFYRWSSLRSSYLAEANVDAARNYAGGGLIPAGNWCGSGWYWNQGFDAYTFIPGDGVYYDPFGWGFYSPWLAFDAPFWGYGWGHFGYGGYGYGRYGYGAYGHHHFGPGYRPPSGALARASQLGGHARTFAAGGGRFGGGPSRGGVSGGGFSGGGFHGGGGFGGGHR